MHDFTESKCISYVQKACKVVCIVSQKLFILLYLFSSNTGFKGDTILSQAEQLDSAVDSSRAHRRGGMGRGSSAVEDNTM